MSTTRPQSESVPLRECYPKPISKAQRGGPGAGERQDRSGGKIETQSRGPEEGHNGTLMFDAGPWTERKKSGRG